MALVRIAAVQASYVLMDQQATLDKVAELTRKAAGQGAQLVVFPEGRGRSRTNAARRRRSATR
jgi:nitrilase